MTAWLRWVHLASVSAFSGALLMLLVMGAAVEPVSPLSFGAIRQAMTLASQTVVAPALLLALASGYLLVVAKPAYIDARWVWAKAALGLALGFVAFATVQPAMNLATGYAVQAAIGAVIPSGAGSGVLGRASMDQALALERMGHWINLTLVLLASVLSVWRPRLAWSNGGARVGQQPQQPHP